MSGLNQWAIIFVTHLISEHHNVDFFLHPLDSSISMQCDAQGRSREDLFAAGRRSVSIIYRRLRSLQSYRVTNISKNSFAKLTIVVTTFHVKKNVLSRYLPQLARHRVKRPRIMFSTPRKISLIKISLFL